MAQNLTSRRDYGCRMMRYDAKGGVEDLKKARVYLDRLIEKEER